MKRRGYEEAWIEARRRREIEIEEDRTEEERD